MPFATPLSARLKSLPGEVKCVDQLASRFVCNAFKLHAGMEFIRTVAFGQLPGNAHQRPCTRRINQCSEVGIGLLPRHCPEPKSGEQHRSVFNEVVGVSATKCSAESEDGRGMCALMSCSACSLSSLKVATAQRRIQLVQPSPRLAHQIPGDRLAGVTFDIHRCSIRPASKGDRHRISPVG
jgi:hypothetical protein